MSANKLAGKIVAITGASSGIGAKTAELAAARGAFPVLLGRNAGKLAEAAEEIDAPHDTFVLDVTDGKQIEETVAAILFKHGKIDIWVNGAGYGEFIPFLETPMRKFREMMEVNYFGLVHCTRAVLPSMLKRGEGHLIQIASMAGKVGSAKAASYSATKHAVLGFTNSLRQELRGSGVKISAVNPGPVDTPFFDIADPQGGYKEGIGFLLLSAEQAARTIVGIMESGRSEADIPFAARLGGKLYLLFPRLLDALAARLLNQK